MSEIIEALVAIQSQLKSPKDQNAGRYRYRNIEAINEAVKPLAAAHGCAVIYKDSFDGDVCVSTCVLTDGEHEVYAHGFAIVNKEPKGMSVEQSCGAASSYARKYAACGLFAIDSSEMDPDRVNASTTVEEKVDAKAVKAKKRLWDAIVRWSELRGADPKATGKDVKSGKYGKYEETADCMNALAAQFEGGCHVE